MKILVFAHRLEVGGTQNNAIELATALRDVHGHDVIFFATPGPLVSVLEKNGLRYFPAPDAYRHPSPSRMRALRDLVRKERPDLIHVWDWWNCLDAYYSVHLAMRIPMVVSDMMMDLTRILPKCLPTTFGVPRLVDKARAQGRRQVELILPTIDINLNRPGAADPRQFCESYGLSEHHIKLVTVSRLSDWVKSESLIRTIDAVRALGRDLPLLLVIVGEGGARPRLESLAQECNRELGRTAVILTGALLNPCPAYAAADIVVGMGGSVLRGMAFGKPAIVVGEENFSAAFTNETAEGFYHKGLYGRGDSNPSNGRLIADIAKLAENPHQMEQLGELGRQFVARNYALEVVSSRLERFFCQAASGMPNLYVGAADGVRTAAVYMRERRFLTYSRDRIKKNEVADGTI